MALPNVIKTRELSNSQITNWNDDEYSSGSMVSAGPHKVGSCLEVG